MRRNLKSRSIRAVIVGVTATMALATPAFAALQWAPATNGIRVCFQPIGFDIISMQQARLSALAWGQVSTNLKVTFGVCAAGTTVIPMRYGTLPTNALGDTQRNWQGTAQSGILTSVSQIYDARQINAWNVPRASAWRGVTCHEMGHALGLEHTTRTDSCMQTNISTPALFPGAYDKAQLIKFYGGTPPVVQHVPTPLTQAQSAGMTLNNKVLTHPAWGVVAEDAAAPSIAGGNATQGHSTPKISASLPTRTADHTQTVPSPRVAKETTPKVSVDTAGPTDSAAIAAWRAHLAQSAK